MFSVKKLFERLGAWLNSPPKLREERRPRLSRTLRVFLVRTGEWEITDLPRSQWRLSSEGREDAWAAGAKIAERLGDDHTGLAVVNAQYASFTYQETTEIIGEALGVQVTTVQKEALSAPHFFEIEEYAAYGSTLVMVVNGTELTSELHRWGGNTESIGPFGPPHGSVYELLVTYYPATVLTGVQEISRKFVD